MIFDGTITGEDGEKRSMTLLEQFSLFRSASMAIGPHGTGLGEMVVARVVGSGNYFTNRLIRVSPAKANIVWMDFNRDTSVIEFVSGPFNSKDPNLDKYRWRTQSFGYWGLPFNYHHLLFTPNSTDDHVVSSHYYSLLILWRS